VVVKAPSIEGSFAINNNNEQGWYGTSFHHRCE
jgi:hypothetical protein